MIYFQRSNTVFLLYPMTEQLPIIAFGYWKHPCKYCMCVILSSNIAIKIRRVINYIQLHYKADYWGNSEQSLPPSPSDTTYLKGSIMLSRFMSVLVWNLQSTRTPLCGGGAAQNNSHTSTDDYTFKWSEAVMELHLKKYCRISVTKFPETTSNPTACDTGTAEALGANK